MALRRGTTTVLKRSLIGCAVLVCAAAPALAATPKQAVHARLAPAAPAKHGTGTFTATGGTGQTVTVRWQLSFSNLTGPAKRATLRTAGARKIVFSLCQPCSAKSHGSFILPGSMWSQILAKGGTVVVTTRAHPAGELRGALKHS